MREVDVNTDPAPLESCRAHCAPVAVARRNRGERTRMVWGESTCCMSGLRVQVFCAVVAVHARASDPDQTIYDWRHYIALAQRKPGALRNGAPFASMPAPLLRLHRTLTRRPGEDRVMAQVLDTVLVVVELALDGGGDAAIVSSEHVLKHVLDLVARLTAAPAPDHVETTL